MKEKQLKAAPGYADAIIVSYVLYLVAIGCLVLGGILMENKTILAPADALGIIGMVLGVFPSSG